MGAAEDSEDMSAKKFLFEGNVPALVTPFNEAGELMTDSLAALVEWHLERGADGICLAGDNGEAWALTHDDRKRIAETAVKAVKKQVPVLMGASYPVPRQTIDAAEIAAKAGVDALMIGPQSYVLKTSLKELTDRFITVHKAVPLPIVVYNSPRRTQINLEPDMLAAICDVVPVIGLKEASRDIFHLTEILARFSERLAVLIGPCPFILPGVALGARGFVASGPELFGREAAGLMALGRAKPSEEHKRVHLALTRVYAALMGTATWPAALKAGLNMVGAPAGVPRQPVQPLSAPDAENIRRVLEDVGILSQARRAGE